VVLILVLVPLSGYFIVRSSKIQTLLVQKVTVDLSERLNAEFTLESVHFSFFNRLILNNVVVKDQHLDTLLHAQKITGFIKSINRKKKKIEFSRVVLDHTQFNLQTDSENILNLRFIIDEIKSKKDSVGPRLDLIISSIEMQESYFSLKLNKSKKKPAGINFTDLMLHDLSFTLDNFHIFNDIIGFIISDLTFTDTSGFHVDKWNTSFQICSNSLEFYNVSIITPLSKLLAEQLIFRYENYQELKNFVETVDLNFKISNSDLAFHDLGYFAPKLGWMSQNIDLSGRFSGKISDFKGRDVRIQFSDMTSVDGNFEIDGLPDLNEAFLFVDIKDLTTSIENLEEFEKPGTGERSYD